MLQPASKLELKRIAIGELIGAAVIVIGFILFKKFDLTVIFGVLLGSIIAVLNFFFLCISVQKAAAKEDPAEAKLIMQSSYTRRMLITTLTVIVGMVVNIFHWLAVVIPLLIPRITILVIQLIGTHQSNSEGGDK